MAGRGGGVILENLSGRKLAVLVGVLLVAQLACFLIGACIAPAPYNTMSVLATKCVDRPSYRLGKSTTMTMTETSNIPDKNNEGSQRPWFYVRGRTQQSCTRINDFSDPIVREDAITANQVVFVFQLPLPREGAELEYSRWFQNLIGVLQLDISYDSKNPIRGKPNLTIEARLGYRNKDDADNDWKLLAESLETRQLDCSLEADTILNQEGISTTGDRDGHFYGCSLLPLFELGSVHHDYYLLNLRLPISDKMPMNEGIGNLQDMWLIAINQNGGFTMVWMSMKLVFFPCIIAVLVWYWRRIQLLSRSPALLEKMILALGLALTQLNVPIELLTLVFSMPFMLLLADIRQGIFYAFLLGFWLVFAGEHMMDDVNRNHLHAYWKHLSAVVFGCLCLFVFDMCERGVQLKNPFYSIWVTELGTNLALTFIILAGVSACIYFLFLCYMIFKVFQNIKLKRMSIFSMSSARRLFYEGVIYRFRFLMVATLLCAALTVTSFIVGQVAEGRWKWDDDIQLQYTSAVVCGVYGTWNVYVFALIVLYAPSHKRWPDADGDHSSIDGGCTEQIECSRLLNSESRGEISALTALAKKVTTE